MIILKTFEQNTYLIIKENGDVEIFKGLPEEISI